MTLPVQLTKNFTMAELLASATARARNIDNRPTPEAMENLPYTAEMLQRIRDCLGRPVIITSAYRSPVLNRAVGGVTSSDHTTGQAADIIAPTFGTPYQVAQRLAPLVAQLGIGQLILEGIKGKAWVHVSTRTPQRSSNRIITITDAGARAGIHPTATGGAA